MSYEITMSIFQDIAILCGFMLLGTILRAKVPFLQKMLIPAPVIGGIIALLLGPQVMGNKAILNFSDDTMLFWSLIPTLLITPIFAAIPLGSGMDGTKKEKGVWKKTLPIALVSGGILFATMTGQAALGLGINFAGGKLLHTNYYRVFGYELNLGFNGGHGAAGSIAALLKAYNCEEWAVTQGVATTFATIGLLGGMILGIIFIKRGSKKGLTSQEQDFDTMPEDIATGCIRQIEEQPSLGRNTMHNSSIESLTLHLGLLLAVSGVGNYVYNLIMKYNIPVLNCLTVWLYALIIMYFVNFILVKCKLNWLIDKNLVSKITGTMSDFAIVAAMASMSVATVMEYIVPICVISVAGFAFTYLTSFVLCRYCVGKDNYSFERGLISWGMNTGVLINGLMLLKMVDPDYKTPVLKDFSAGMAVSTMLIMPMGAYAYYLLATGTTFANFLFYAGATILGLALALTGRHLLKKAA